MLHNISTGCKTIDRALDGGIPLKSVSLIYGEAETGKTTIAMQCAINCAKHGYKTLFIDCDGTFSAQRLSQIAAEDFKQVSDLIILVKPNSFREQATLIDQLTDYIATNFGLVVFDTITSLYRAKVADDSEETFKLNRELNRELASIAQIARTQNIAILATSQVRSSFKEMYGSVEPVGTRVLKFWADIIIALKPTEERQVIRAILEKAPKKTKEIQPLTSYLKIDKTGMHEHPVH